MNRKSATAAAIATMASVNLASAADRELFARRRIGTSRELHKERGLSHHVNEGPPRRRHLRRGGEVQWNFWPFFHHLIPTLSDQISDEIGSEAPESEDGEKGVEADLSVTQTKAELMQDMVESDLEMLSMEYKELVVADFSMEYEELVVADFSMEYEELAVADGFSMPVVDGIEMSMSMSFIAGDEGTVGTASTPSPADAEVDIPEPVEVAAGVSNDVPLFFGKRRRLGRSRL